MKKVGPKKNRQKKHSNFHRKVGKAPGTITYLGKREGVKSTVTVIDYDDSNHTVYYPETLEDVVSYKQNQKVSWINVIGLSEEEFVERIGKDFGLNPLIMEDAVNTQQRPKVDEYEDYIFGVFKMLYVKDSDDIVGEHVAFVLLNNAVLVFQELQEDVFGGVRERLKNKYGRIRSRGADYLFFALLDAIIDNYFIVLENLSHRIEGLEEEVYDNPTPDVAHRIQQLKKEVLRIRRSVFPVRELIVRLIESENPLIKKDTKLFLRDAHDHATEINESLQIYREMSMSLMEMYMSNISNKMNEVMKVLTIMASIFIPLTFIAGIYGMNFDHMPELHWEYGYIMVWGVMILLFIAMLIYFKRKNWL